MTVHVSDLICTSNGMMANEWEKAVKVLREEITRNRTEIKAAIEASESRLLLKIEELNHRVNKLETENNFLTNKIETLEITSKKNNIIIFGLQTSEDLSPLTVCKELNTRLDVEVQVSDLNNIYRLKTQGRKPLKVEFISYLKKLEVLKQCKKLKGSGITIANDLTYKQRCQNRILRSHLNQARQNTSDRSYIKGNKLYINNRAYTVEELEENEYTSTEERKINSAPSTPIIRNLEKELELNEQTEKRSEGTLDDSSAIEKSSEAKKSKNSNTPTTSHNKKSAKTAADQPTRERIRSLRSGLVTSGRV